MFFSPYVAPILMLALSNVFMTFAWYGHLKVKAAPLIAIILVSWGIAFFEYCLAVPANRIGHQVYSAAQLKTIQEVITLTVFVAFSVFFLKESISWQVVLGFALIAVGGSLVFFAPGKAPVAMAAPAPAAQVSTE
nr:DMT family protein [Zoogloeaceae bacterium]